MSCAPSMPQNHIGPDLLNLSPPSLALHAASNFPSLSPISVMLQRHDVQEEPEE